MTVYRRGGGVLRWDHMVFLGEGREDHSSPIESKRGTNNC